VEIKNIQKNIKILNVSERTTLKILEINIIKRINYIKKIRDNM